MFTSFDWCCHFEKAKLFLEQYVQTHFDLSHLFTSLLNKLAHCPGLKGRCNKLKSARLPLMGHNSLDHTWFALPWLSPFIKGFRALCLAETDNIMCRKAVASHFWAHTHTHTQARTHACAHTHTRAPAPRALRAHIHTHTRTHTQSHTHTPKTDCVTLTCCK